MSEDTNYSAKEELTEIEKTIANLEGKIKNSEDQVRRHQFVILFILAIAASVICFSLFHLKEILAPNSIWPSILVIVSLIFFFVGISVIGAFKTMANLEKERINIFKSEIDGCRREKDIINQFIESEKKPSYFDRLVAVNTSRLDEYYKLVEGQTQTSFKVTIFMSIIGFILIGVGLIVGFINFAHFNMITYISPSVGVIVEMISGIFFVFHNKIVQQIRGYYNNTITAQNTLFAFQLIENTEDKDVKAKIIAMVAASLMNKRESVSSPEEK